MSFLFSDRKLFYGLTELEDVYLDGNNIKFIAEMALPLVRILKLQNNNLTSILNYLPSHVAGTMYNSTTTCQKCT